MFVERMQLVHVWVRQKEKDSCLGQRSATTDMLAYSATLSNPPNAKSCSTGNIPPWSVAAHQLLLTIVRFVLQM